MSDLAKLLSGKFIVLDGPDGSGKSTQLARLGERLRAQGGLVESVYDPGATKIGEKIRDILLNIENGRMSPMCETLLFMASRAQLLAERVGPALGNDKIVLCDRFISATIAYQGASGIDPRTIIELGDTAVRGLWPDLTIILDVPVKTGMRRIGLRHGGSADRMEAKGQPYHQAVRRVFKELGRYYPRPVVYVCAEKSADEVFRDVMAALEKTFVPEGGPARPNA